jgi:hypothetical protein
MCMPSEYPPSLQNESLVQILRFSLSVAVLQVKYITSCTGLIAEFSFLLCFSHFISVVEPHPSSGLHYSDVKFYGHVNAIDA